MAKSKDQITDWESVKEPITDWEPVGTKEDSALKTFAENTIEALPAMGGMIGGTVGAVGGLGVGAVPLSLLGAGAGESARQLIQYLRGKYQPQTFLRPTEDVAKEMAGMAAGEGAGAVISKLPIKTISSMLTGTPKEAIEYALSRPSQVLSAAGKKAIDVATKAKETLLAKNEAEREAISSARDIFRKKFGSVNVPTETIKGRAEEMLGKLVPESTTAGEIGPLSSKRVERYGGLLEKGLTTPEPVDPLLVGDTGKRIPVQEAGNLQKFADELDAKITFSQSKLPGNNSKGMAFLKTLRGMVKQSLHGLDPNGLAAADEAFTKWASDAKFLKNLENPQKMEAFSTSLFQPNKEGARRAVQRNLGVAGDEMLDLSAGAAFKPRTMSNMYGSDIVRALIRPTGITSPWLHKQLLLRGAPIVSQPIPVIGPSFSLWGNPKENL